MEAKIIKTVDFMVGGCNVCPTVKTDIYNLCLNGKEWSLEQLDSQSLVATVALANGYKQYQEYGLSEDYDVYKKDGNEVAIIPNFNKVIFKSGTKEKKVANTYSDVQQLFNEVNQLLGEFFEIETVHFVLEENV